MDSKSSPSRRRDGTRRPTPELAEAGGGDLPHYLGHRQRLRERFLNGGRDALPDYELLELLLFMAIPRVDTKPLAKDLLDRFGSFGDLIAAPIERLREEKLSENTIAALKVVEAAALRLGFAARDRGLGIGPLDVLVNDRIAARIEAAAVAAADPITVEVPLDPGPNRVVTRLYAEDRTLFAEGPSLDLRRPGDRVPPAGAGRLVVLAIGVDRYANETLNLRFAVADARSVAEMLRAGGRGLFDEVSVTLLTDGQATRRGMLEAMAAAAARTAPGDTFAFYVAGHGVLTEPDRRFLFLPADVSDTSSWEALRRAALDEDALVSALARIRARDGFLFVDTCYAGKIAVDSLAAIGNETGRFLLTASTSVQQALDSYDGRNGVFAYAVLEGLRGRAAVDAEGRVSALALGEWVTRRVPQLAAEKQHNQNAVFRTAQRDLRSFPLAAVAR